MSLLPRRLVTAGHCHQLHMPGPMDWISFPKQLSHLLSLSLSLTFTDHPLSKNRVRWISLLVHYNFGERLKDCLLGHKLLQVKGNSFNLYCELLIGLNKNHVLICVKVFSKKYLVWQISSKSSQLQQCSGRSWNVNFLPKRNRPT